MGKVLKVLGALFLIVIIFVAGVFIYAMTVGPQLDSDSKAYVDSTIPILTKDWNPEELRGRASMELLPLLKEPDLSNLYRMFRKLGRMTRYNGAKGEAQIKISPQNLTITTRAAYLATADFENGPATMKMSLTYTDNIWQISEFRVDSPIYFQQ
jgi:hypothetical protein